MAKSILSAQTAALELEKLQHELEVLRRPFWKDPKVLGASIAFLLSVVVNAVQFTSNREESARKDKELAIKIEQWQMQRKQLEKQPNQPTKSTPALSAGAEAELEQVKRDIAVWEDAVAKSQLQISAMRSQVPRFEKEGRTERAAAERANIELQEGLLGMQRAELQKSLDRRAQLEACSK